MLIWIFLVLLAIAILLISLGYAVGESSYSIIGFFFIFLLSMFTLLPGDLEYPSGENITQTYVYEENSTNILSVQETRTDIYEPFEEASTKTYSIWLAVISSIGIAISAIEYSRYARQRKGDDDDA